MSRSLRIVAADDERSVRDYYQELLPRLGHQVVTAADGRQLLELSRAAEPDLIITDIKMPEIDGLAAVEAVGRVREVPVILVSAHQDSELRSRAVRSNVMAYLVKPVRQADMEAAIDLAMHRFEENRALRLEATELRQALEDRKLIERAKGTVMRRLGVSEEGAYNRLRKLASDHNRKLIEVARRVLEAEAVFGELEGCGVNGRGAAG